MILYNLHTDGDQYRITKFDDGNPVSSYLLTERECECPAGHRPTCRHRQMLPHMLGLNILNTHWFIIWDTQVQRARVVDFEGAPQPKLFIEPAIDPTDIRSPNDVYTEKDFIAEVFAKDITPATPSRPWRRL